MKSVMEFGIGDLFTACSNMQRPLVGSPVEVDFHGWRLECRIGDVQRPPAIAVQIGEPAPVGPSVYLFALFPPHPLKRAEGEAFLSRFADHVEFIPIWRDDQFLGCEWDCPMPNGARS